MTTAVYVKFLILVVTFNATILFVKGEGECGRLAIRNTNITAGTKVRIQFYPSTNLKHVVDNGNYRWILRNRTSQNVVYEKRFASKYGSRLSEENYILSINDVREGDEGTYKVQCWYKSPKKTILYHNSESVDLKLQESFITVTTTIKPIHIVTETRAIETSSPSSTTGLDVKVASSIGSQTSDDNGSWTTAIVGAISGVVILTVATVILVLILRKKRPFKKENNNNEEKAGFIDDSAANEYATVNDCAKPQDQSNHCNHLLVDVDPYNSIEQPLVRSDTPVFEDKRSPNEAKIADEYSIVIPKSLRKDNRIIAKSDEIINETKEDEYATIIPKSERKKNDTSCTKTNKIDSSLTEEYASVIPKSKRNINGDRECSTDKTDKRNALEQADFADIAMRLEGHRMREQWHSTPDLLNSKGNQYSNILLSSMRDLTSDVKRQHAKPVPKDQRLLDIHGLDSVRTSRYKQGTDTEHEYDTPSLIIRRKIREKELQYIQIDVSDTSSYRSQSTESLDARPVQYSDIDFTKKAFVAPKRYPPPPSPKRTH